MNPSTLDFVPFGLMRNYPHMAELDRAIWERFIVANPTAFDFCAYDIAVGEGASFDETAGGVIGGNIKKLYQRKIDVVATKNGELFIIECKPRATTSAIGQVKGYASLFVRDHAPGKQVQCIIVTDELMPEMEYLAKPEGVTLVVA